MSFSLLTDGEDADDDRKLSPKCVKIARPQLFGYIETREEFEFYVNQLFKRLQSGELKVKIHKVYPLDQVQQAHIVSVNILRVDMLMLAGSRGKEDYRKAVVEAITCVSCYAML